MPKKRGRFIPCRAGGTDTTYYTDPHDVDEELRTISIWGGRWGAYSTAGIALRSLDNSPTVSGDHVASRLIYLS